MLPVPSDQLLKSRSYIGLLLSQFLAAFNDQAIHFVAIFYAGDMLVRYVGAPHVDEKLIVTIVTACFISPFFFFSPLAGQLADKFSKRSTIVFWKYAEIGITGLALLGFVLPHTAVASPHALAAIGAVCVIAAVFMMGTHSAFFVPAKYGIMPEILSTSVLSRGNGLLEGTSFTANILGTAFGGFCYAQLKSKIDPTAGTLEPGHEWIIGLVLVGLAVLGTLAARLVERVPAAAPEQDLIWQPWIPLKANLAVLRTSRPLVLATVGIAFFTFMTLFVRQTLIFQGESRRDYHEYRDKRKNEKRLRDEASKRAAIKRAAEAAADSELDDVSEKPGAPTVASQDSLDLDAADVIPEASSSQREELRIAMLAALVGLGVGMGCAAAGVLSGDRIELGLVPIGAGLMMILTAILAWVIPTAEGQSPWPTRICLLLVGVAAGLYIVPLYTLLQHRAPKESKGSLVAMSNFLNVSGGLVAIGVFYFLTYAFQSLFGLTTTRAEATQSFERLTKFVHELGVQLEIPRLLFLAGSFITLVMLVLLCWARPDFLVRTLSWFRVPGRRRLHAVGLSNVPSDGHIILATNCHGTDQWFQVLSAIDRGSRFVKQPGGQSNSNGEDTMLESLARRLRILIPAPLATSGSEWDRIVDSGAKSLETGNLVGLALDCQSSGAQSEALLKELESRVISDVLPVYCGASPTGHTSLHRSPWRPIVIVGEPLGPQSSPEEIRAAIRALGDASLQPDAKNLKSHV